MKLLNCLLVFAVLAFAGCSFDGGTSERDVEAVLPQDSTVVIALDYSDSGQVDALKNLKTRFPDTGLWQIMIDGYNTEIGDAEEDQELLYENLIQPIIENDWKVLMGMKFDGAKSLQALEEGNAEVYIVGKFADKDQFGALLERLLNEFEVVEGEKDGVELTTVEAEDIYIAQYKDIFFMTNTAAYRDAGIDRLMNGGGLDENDEFSSTIEGMAEHNFGYVYVDSEGFGPILEEIYAQWGPGMNSALAALGDVYMVMAADNEGVKLLSHSKLIGTAEEIAVAFPKNDRNVDLVNKVPGEGMFVYLEESTMTPYLAAFWAGFTTGYNGIDVNDFSEGGDLRDLLSTENLYNDLMETVAKIGGISVEDAEKLANSPFAFAMQNVGELYPAMSLYVDVADGSAEAAEKLTLALDTYFDEVLVEFDSLGADIGGLAGFIKNDVVAVNGGGVHRIYLDWSALPEEALADLQIVPTLSVADIKAELYYGVTGDDVFVISLFPGFADKYGKAALADEVLFKDAVEKLGDTYGFSLSYIATESIMDLADKYVGISDSLGLVADEDIVSYEKIRDFVKAVPYMVSSGVIQGETMRSDGYLRIK